MRVISGSARGLNLLSPDGMSTRPTTDRVKEAMFNIIQTKIPCDKVLDLFSGSGALGIEALSRGCRKCVFVENDLTSFGIINKNIEKARLSDKSELYRQDAFLYLEKCQEKFNIIFLDPPYNKGFLDKIFLKIKNNNLLSDDGIIVVETEYNGETPECNDFLCINSKKYGKTMVLIYKLRQNEE